MEEFKLKDISLASLGGLLVYYKMLVDEDKENNSHGMIADLNKKNLHRVKSAITERTKQFPELWER